MSRDISTTDFAGLEYSAAERAQHTQFAALGDWDDRAPTTTFWRAIRNVLLLCSAFVSIGLGYYGRDIFRYFWSLI